MALVAPPVAAFGGKSNVNDGDESVQVFFRFVDGRVSSCSIIVSARRRSLAAVACNRCHPALN